MSETAPIHQKSNRLASSLLFPSVPEYEQVEDTNIAANHLPHITVFSPTKPDHFMMEPEDKKNLILYDKTVGDSCVQVFIQHKILKTHTINGGLI